MLDARTREELNEAYRIMRIVGIGIMASLPILLLIVELLKKQYTPFKGFDPTPGSATVRYVIFGLCFGMFPLIRLLWNRIVSGQVPLAVRSGATSRAGILLSRMRSASVVSLALCETVAMFGFVLFLVGGNSTEFYALLALSLVFFAVNFPRYRQWEEFLERSTVTHTP